MPFSLASVPGAKRASEDAAAPEKKKPRVCDVVVEERGAKPARAPSKRPENGPIVVCVYKFSDDAGDCWEEWKGTDQPLFAILVEHEVRRGCLMYLRDSFNEFLKQSKAQDGNVPGDTKTMEAIGWKLVLSDTQDPYNVGVKQWQVCFYIVGEENTMNFMSFFQDFVMYKEKSMAQRFDVHVTPHVSANDLKLENDAWTVQDACKSPPLPLFSAQPPVSKKPIVMQMAFEEDTLTIVIVGNTYAYWGRMDDMQIQRGMAGAERVRVMKVEAEEPEKVLNMIALFKNRALYCFVEHAPEYEAGEKLLEQMKELPNLFFA